MTISNEIQDAIKKNLPNMVAIELQTFIKQSERDAALLKEAKTNLEAFDIEVTGLRKENETLKSLNLREENLDKRKFVLDEQERNMKVVLAEFKATAAENKAEMIYNLAHGLVRNTEFKKTLHNIYPIATHYNSGNGNTSTMVNNYEDKKASIEEAV